MNTKQTSSKILGRAWIYDTGDPFEIELWEHKIEPMTLGKRSGADWAREYFCECFNDTDIRKFFKLPLCEGNFQVVFSGEMTGCMSGGAPWDGQEWDEQFDLDEGFEVVEIPELFMAVRTEAKR